MRRIIRVAMAAIVAGSLFVLTACSSSQSTESESNVPSVNVTEAAAMIEDGGANEICILDVRTPEEYSLGHLADSVNIDYYEDDFRTNLDALDRDKTYIVYCRCGVRGAASVEMMQELGFQDVYNMEEGFLEWEFQQLPTEK